MKQNLGQKIELLSPKNLGKFWAISLSLLLDMKTPLLWFLKKDGAHFWKEQKENLLFMQKLEKHNDFFLAVLVLLSLMRKGDLFYLATYDNSHKYKRKWFF